MTNLKKCKDCGKEISKSADRCPHCGAKPPGCGSFICLLIVALAISIFFITSCSRSDAPPATPIKMSNDSKRFKATEQNFSVVVDDKTKTTNQGITCATRFCCSSCCFPRAAYLMRNSVRSKCRHARTRRRALIKQCPHAPNCWATIPFPSKNA